MKSAEDWLDYEGTVRVDGEKTVSYVVSPGERGTYRLVIAVDGPGGFYSEDTVKLWVSGREAESLPANEGEGPGAGGLTGMFTLSEQEQSVLIAAAVVIAAVFAVFLALRTLKEEDGPEAARV